MGKASNNPWSVNHSKEYEFVISIERSNPINVDLIILQR